MNFLQTMADNRAKMEAGTDAGTGAATDNIFGVADGEVPAAAAAIIDAVPAAPADAPIVVVEPEDAPFAPEEAPEIEDDAVASECLLAAVASAESFGWSPALVSVVQQQGLLTGTALATMSLESFAGGKTFSMEEAEGVDAEVHSGLGARLKSWSANALTRLHGMWDHVSGKLTKSEASIAADETAGVAEEERRAIPYKTIAAIAAGVVAAGGVIYLCFRSMNMSALTSAGGVDRAASSIDKGLSALAGKLPEDFGVYKLALRREPGAFLPKFVKEVRDAGRLHDLKVKPDYVRLPRQVGWTTEGLKSLRSAVGSTKDAIGKAFGGLKAIATKPTSVAEGILTDPGLKTKVTAGGLVAFLATIVGVASWVLYHVVLKGVNVITSACRAVAGRRGTPAEGAAA